MSGGISKTNRVFRDSHKPIEHDEFFLYSRLTAATSKHVTTMNNYGGKTIMKKVHRINTAAIVLGAIGIAAFACFACQRKRHGEEMSAICQLLGLA
jgi:hypothetical protein